jgi:hypothetical protein
MCFLVTGSAQRNQVLFLVRPEMASEHEMMCLQALHCATPLTSPAVTLQDRPMEFGVSFWTQTDSRTFRIAGLHEGAPVTSARKASR